MTCATKLQAALYARPGQKLTAHALCRLADLTLKQFHRDAATIHRQGKISRDKPESGHGFYRYFLTDTQRTVFELKAALKGAKGGDVGLAVEHNIGTRLEFLRMLKEKTLFGEHAVLDLIISDYERTRRLRAGEQQDDEFQRSKTSRRAT